MQDMDKRLLGLREREMGLERGWERNENRKAGVEGFEKRHFHYEQVRLVGAYQYYASVHRTAGLLGLAKRTPRRFLISPGPRMKRLGPARPPKWLCSAQ
jgi:hypothetical protein